MNSEPHFKELKKIQIAKAFPFFDSELRSELDRVGVMKIYKAGEVLVRTGEEIKHTTILLSGCVKISRENEKNHEFSIAFLRSGQGFGVSICEASSIKDRSSIVTFKAMSPSYVLAINYADKDAMAKKYNQWYEYILRIPSQFYRFYINLIDNMAYWSVEQRLIYFLVQIAEARNSNEIKITHQEIANALNASRETISRLLKKLENEKKMRLSNKHIEIFSSLNK